MAQHISGMTHDEGNAEQTLADRNPSLSPPGASHKDLVRRNPSRALPVSVEKFGLQCQNSVYPSNARKQAQSGVTVKCVQAVSLISYGVYCNMSHMRRMASPDTMTALG